MDDFTGSHGTEREVTGIDMFVILFMTRQELS